MKREGDQIVTDLVGKAVVLYEWCDSYRGKSAYWTEKQRGTLHAVHAHDGSPRFWIETLSDDTYGECKKGDIVCLYVSGSWKLRLLDAAEPTVTYRGSATDVATDLAAFMPKAKIVELARALDEIAKRL